MLAIISPWLLVNLVEASVLAYKWPIWPYYTMRSLSCMPRLPKSLFCTPPSFHITQKVTAKIKDCGSNLLVPVSYPEVAWAWLGLVVPSDGIFPFPAAIKS